MWSPSQHRQHSLGYGDSLSCPRAQGQTAEWIDGVEFEPAASPELQLPRVGEDMRWSGAVPQTPSTKNGTEERLYWCQIVKLMSCSTKYNAKSDTRESQSTDFFIESHIADSVVIQLTGWVVYVIHSFSVAVFLQKNYHELIEAWNPNL